MTVRILGFLKGTFFGGDNPQKVPRTPRAVNGSIDGFRPLYHRWQSMKGMCYNPSHGVYHTHGARGIKVCNEWRDNFAAFKAWSLEHGYSKEKSCLVRIDNNGNYEPANCKWVSKAEASSYRTNAVLVTHNGETKTLYAWSKELGRDYGLVYKYYRDGNFNKLFA